MQEILFCGSARLEAADFIAAEKLSRKGCFLWFVILAETIFFGIVSALMPLYMTAIAVTDIDSLNLKDLDAVLVVCTIMFAMNFFCLLNFGTGSGRKRAKAPMNRDRRGELLVYGDKIVYKDEFMELSAAYSDIAKVKCGSRVIVFIFDAADYIFIPRAAFEDSGMKLTAYLKQTLGKRVK